MSRTLETLSYSACFLEDCSGVENDSTIKFGYLRVIENRESTNGNELNLAFVILKSLSNDPKPDPIVYLSGGPGSQSIRNLDKWKVHFLRQERDIILTDFRGIGYSAKPICSNLTDEYFNLVASNYSPEEEQKAKMKIVLECFDALKLQGFDFGSYRSQSIVFDLEALRKALNYKQWNLYGGSYGTRLGQTYLRDAPEGVRAFISEATHPVGIDVLGNEVSTYRQSLDELFDLCRNSPDCKMQFKKLEPRFYSAMEKLKKQPIVIEDEYLPNGRFYIDFQNAHQIFQQLLYFRSFYVAFPWFIKAIENEDYEAFKNIIYFLKDRFGHISMVNYLMVLRNDAFANIKQSDLPENDPLYKALAFTEADFNIFHRMNFVSYDSIESEPVKSDVPTLILAGSMDPISPPQHGKFVHQNFTNSYYMEFAGMGHGVMSNECAKKITRAFLNQPQLEPDRGCLESLTESKVAFLPKIYENGKITTFIRRLALNQDIKLVLPLGLAFILWILALLQATIGLFKKSTQPFSLMRTRLIIRSVSTITCLLFVGLAWYVYHTFIHHELLILVGLVNQVSLVFWLSPLIIVGSLISLFLIIKDWHLMERTGDKILNASQAIVQLSVAVVIFVFNLFPIT